MEPLCGTVVHLGCCKKEVHIQCYVPKCPFCRSELPVPPNHPPQHIIVPIAVPPVVRPVPTWRHHLASFIFCGGIVSLIIFTMPATMRPH